MSINDVLVAIDDFLWDTPFLALLIICGVVLVITSGGFIYSHFGHVVKTTFGSLFDKEERQASEGSISPFEAMCVAVGGCIGMGNMAGVAAAIASGGPGAVILDVGLGLLLV